MIRINIGSVPGIKSADMASSLNNESLFTCRRCIVLHDISVIPAGCVPRVSINLAGSNVYSLAMLKKMYRVKM